MAKGCWTCRDRKVRCDFQLPTCGNCAISGRPCKGYGLKLSWPREGNTRRAIVLQKLSRETQYGNVEIEDPKRLEFLNTTVWDIELHHELLYLGSFSSHRNTLNPSLNFTSLPFAANEKDSRLLGFFMQNGPLLLTSTHENTLTKFVLSAALSSSTTSSNAVLQAILAVSSLRLDGANQGLRYQTKAISLLRSSLYDENRKEDIVRNLTATMLLCLYEIVLTSNTTWNWAVFLCGAKKILRAKSSQFCLDDPGIAILLNWIYYHEVISEFGLRHWAQSYERVDICKQGPSARSRQVKSGSINVVNTIGCSIDVLDLLSIICRLQMPNSNGDAPYSIDKINDICEDLEKLSMRHLNLRLLGDTVESSRGTQMAELHQLAALIYLNRIMRGYSGEEYRHKRIVRESLLLLEKLEVCESPWPLFIIACEACEDAQRLTILKVLDKTQREQGWSNKFSLIQQLVEAIWNQSDLDECYEVDYATRMNAVISAVPFLPAFS
ncbi:fungal-specific transcription factor domain-containing protein [Xylogone sp. PMI_703]|nr:fungal-specific transcription factor domain-containing protein [Xylogone sp. PMI_703]